MSKCLILGNKKPDAVSASGFFFIPPFSVSPDRFGLPEVATPDPSITKLCRDRQCAGQVPVPPTQLDTCISPTA